MSRMSGRAAFLELLADEGVTHFFGNPGTTELPIMEVMPDFPQLRYVLGLHEGVVVGMADGFCRASKTSTTPSARASPKSFSQKPLSCIPMKDHFIHVVWKFL